MLEKDIEVACVMYAHTKKFMNFKMETRGTRGWPDQAFYGPDGIHFQVEFKQPGKKPTPQQVSIIEALAAMGHDVWVIDDVEDFKHALDAEIEAHR